MASFESFLQVAGRQYRVYHSDVELHQYTDILGRPASPTFGGTYVLDIETPPQGDATLYGWMVHPALFLNGQVLTKNLSTDTTLKVIKFFNAYCVELEDLFDGTGSDGRSRSYRTRLTISPQAVEIGAQFHDNNWPAPEPIVNWDWTEMDAICNPKPKRGFRQPTILLPPTRTPPLKKPPRITLPPIAPLVTGALVFIAGVLYPHPAGPTSEWGVVTLPEQDEQRWADLEAKRKKLEREGKVLSPAEYEEWLALDQRKFPRSRDNSGNTRPRKKETNEESRQDLIDELRANGVKFDESKIVRIGRDANGKIVFLEEGVTSEQAADQGLKGASGLAHIIEEHGEDFERKGIPKGEIPDFVMGAVTKGKIVKYQGKGTGRPVYEYTYKGKTYHVAVTIGSNGYIVGANPVSI